MLLIREIMYCKPGKVRPMVDKFKAMNKLAPKAGMPTMRIMTDFCAEKYWTLVAEMEVESLAEFDKMNSGASTGDPETDKAFGEIMKDYHDLVVAGRREVFKIEA
jgi:hypothetical protein